MKTYYFAAVLSVSDFLCGVRFFYVRYAPLGGSAASVGMARWGLKGLGWYDKVGGERRLVCRTTSVSLDGYGAWRRAPLCF